jgi:hypothetical protein
VLQPVKASFRQSIWGQNQMTKEVGSSDKAGALFDTAQRGWAVLQAFDFVDVVSIATTRLTDVLVFATVVERTPLDIPYWGGSSFHRLASVPIPRLLYPEKPDYMEGNVFAHEYAMLGPDNFTTSINIPQVTELYGSFGPLGVVVGCLLLGIAYRTINDLFIHEKCGLGAIVVVIYLSTHLVDIENAISDIFGGLFFESIVALLFHYGIRLTETVLEARRLNRSDRFGLFEPELIALPREKYR